ncbi:hypothetical protein FI667_g7240, partial [Globisporangium splendens]
MQRFPPSSSAASSVATASTTKQHSAHSSGAATSASRKALSGSISVAALLESAPPSVALSPSSSLPRFNITDLLASEANGVDAPRARSKMKNHSSTTDTTQQLPLSPIRKVPLASPIAPSTNLFADKLTEKNQREVVKHQQPMSTYLERLGDPENTELFAYASTLCHRITGRYLPKSVLQSDPTAQKHEIERIQRVLELRVRELTRFEDELRTRECSVQEDLEQFQVQHMLARRHDEVLVYERQQHDLVSAAGFCFWRVDASPKNVVVVLRTDARSAQALRGRDKDAAIRELSVQPLPMLFQTASTQTEVDDDGLWDVQVRNIVTHHVSERGDVRGHAVLAAKLVVEHAVRDPETHPDHVRDDRDTHDQHVQREQPRVLGRPFRCTAHKTPQRERKVVRWERHVRELQQQTAAELHSDETRQRSPPFVNVIDATRIRVTARLCRVRRRLHLLQ